MLIAYIDESGNTGEIDGGGSLTFALGCVLVHARDWPTAFDALIGMRRTLRDAHHLPVRAEVKAQYLIRDSGSLRGLGIFPTARQDIYRQHLAALAGARCRAFSVVVDKRTPHRDYFDLAWEGLLQRLERTSTREREPVMIMHDEGENDRVRKWVRRARRHLTAGRAFGGGSYVLPAGLLVDDPVPRQSHQSYFIQLADLVAYAGFRAYLAPGQNVAKVCPSDMWAAIGPATHTAVSGLRPRSAPGIVIR